MNVIRVRDWTETPGGRYRQQGPFSGEAFREEVLLPALKNGPVEVDIEGVAGFGTGWLEEVFGGSIRADRNNYRRIRVTGETGDNYYSWKFAISAMDDEARRLCMTPEDWRDFDNKKIDDLMFEIDRRGREIERLSALVEELKAGLVPSECPYCGESYEECDAEA